MKKRKILVIRFSAIGDIVWTSPAIRCLKTQLPDIELHFATKSQYREMVENNPYIDKIHYLDNDLNALIKNLQKEQFEYVVDLHKNLRTSIIKFRLGKKSYSYSKMSLKRWLFVNFKLPIMQNIHVADRYLQAISPLGIISDNGGLDYFLGKEDEVLMQDLPISHQKGYVVFIIGASTFTKKLPLKKMIEMCEAIDRPIILLGGNEEIEMAKELEKVFQNHASKVVIYNGCGKYRLNQSVSIAEKAQIIVGHDTGLTHIMAAFKKTIYGIYGGTSTLGFFPYQTDFIPIENNNLSCRPCSKSGRDNCPEGHFKCMNDLVFNFNLPEFDEKLILNNE